MESCFFFHDQCWYAARPYGSKHTQCLAESVGVSQGVEKGFVKKLRVFVDLEDTAVVLQCLGVEDIKCYFNLPANIYYSRCVGRCMETEVVVSIYSNSGKLLTFFMFQFHFL